ncbi:MAG: hypothetical protein V2I35_03960, partial [Desulfocapsaceae bacterium]|nr:hypothetical protein [Desulfocapsaceae bacterium]
MKVKSVREGENPLGQGAFGKNKNKKNRGYPRFFYCVGPKMLGLDLAFHHEIRRAQPGAFEK